MTLFDDAEAWRSFLGLAYREACIQIERAAARVTALPKGTPERRKASREVRERTRTRDSIANAWRSLSFRRST